MNKTRNINEWRFHIASFSLYPSSFILLLFLLVLGPGVSQAKTIYVSTGGLDTNSCGSAETCTSQTCVGAKRTLAGGLSCLASGDTLSLRGGSYPSVLSSTWNAIPSGGGSRATATTIQGHPGETVTITHHGGATSEAVISFDATTKAWITLKNFKVLGTGNNADGIRLAAAPDFMRLENIEITDFGQNGILAGGGDAQPYQWSVGMELADLWIHDGGGRGPNGFGFEHCIYLTSIKDSILENSVIEDCNAGFGLHFFGAPEEVSTRNWIVRNNIVRRAAQAGVIFQDVDYPIYFYNNIVTDSLGGAMFRDNGVFIWNNTICNNAGNWPGLWLFVDTGTPFDGIVAENNIVCNNSGADGVGGLRVDAGITDAVVRNNLIYGNTTAGSPTNYVNNGTGTVESWNLVGSTFSADFTNEAGDDYTLTSTSDARNAGRNLSAETGGFTTSLNGVSRPQGTQWDIGAYEFVEGGGDVTAPTVPGSLTATAVSFSEIALDWANSTDAVGVTEYRVERSPAGCGSFVQIAVVTGNPPTSAYTANGLTASTPYCFRVRAADLAQNVSGYSNTASDTTLAQPDVTPPTTPTGLTVTLLSTSELSLDWGDSFDAGGVTEYRIERSPAGCGNFQQIATVTGTPPVSAYTASGLLAGTPYCFRVSAADIVPNVSGYSNSASGTTAENVITFSGSYGLVEDSQKVGGFMNARSRAFGPITVAGGTGITAPVIVDIQITSFPWACTRYASPTGAGTACSAASPCTIEQAENGASCGQVVCLLSGVYSGADTQIINVTGRVCTADNPLVIRALHDGQARINGQGIRVPATINDQSSGIVLAGLNLNDSVQEVAAVFGSTVTLWRIAGWDAGGSTASALIYRVDSVLPGTTETHARGVGTAKDLLFDSVVGIGRARQIFSVFEAERVNFRNAFARWRCTPNTGTKEAMASRSSVEGLFEDNILTWDHTSAGTCAGDSITLMTTQAFMDPLNEERYSDDIKNFQFSGNIALLRQADGVPMPNRLFNTATERFVTWEHNVASIEAGAAHTTVRGFELLEANDGAASSPVASPCGPGLALSDCNYVYANNTTLHNGLVNSIHADWLQSGNEVDQSPRDVATNVWAADGVGANICRRFQRGVRTGLPRWPYDMNQRVLDAQVLAGHAPYDVTAQVVTALGAIPEECKISSTYPDIVTFY